MFTTVCSAAVYGLQAYLVRVEVDRQGTTIVSAGGVAGE